MNVKYNRYGVVRENHVLRNRDAFVLMQRTYAARPCGDGWETVVEEVRWNEGKKNPLELTARVRAAKKQAAARMVRKVETMDSSHAYIIDPATEMYFDLGRNEGEVRPNTTVQGVRGTNFDLGGKYAGGTKAVRDALKKRKEYDKQPDKVKGPSAEEVRNSKIEDLERQVRELMGLLKK